MDPPRDDALVERVLAGDRGAFRRLVERHAAAVHRICYGLLGHHQDAEDAAQDTFLRAYRALERFDARFSFRNWLLKIATNLCRDRLRRRRWQLSLAEYRPWSEPQAPAEDEPRFPTSGDLLHRVERAVAELPLVYREVFILYHQEGRSCAEISELLDRPVGTVKTQLHRARRRVCESVERMAEPREQEGTAFRSETAWGTAT